MKIGKSEKQIGEREETRENRNPKRNPSEPDTSDEPSAAVEPNYRSKKVEQRLAISKVPVTRADGTYLRRIDN